MVLISKLRILLCYIDFLEIQQNGVEPEFFIYIIYQNDFQWIHRMFTFELDIRIVRPQKYRKGGENGA